MRPLPHPSRRAPLLFALLLALSAGLAGCFTSDEGADPAGEPGGAEGDADTTGDGSATPPPVDTRKGPSTANGTGDRPHLHDYWQEKERVVLFDGEVDLSALDPFGWTFARAYFEKQPAVGGAEWRLPDGAIVYEGTGQLDLTTTWTDPRITSLAVAYRTPASQELQPFVDLSSGKTLSVDVTPEMTDMPHMSTSRWAFVFASGVPGAALGTFNLKVEVVKMRDVGLFPAHPDLFEGKPEKVLHDHDHDLSEVSYPKRVPNVVTSGEFGEKEVTLASLVPMETQWMRVEVDVSRATADPGQVADIRFFYHGADRSLITHPFLLPIEGSLAEKRLVYAFPVTMEETDTPYGKESQWRFFVEPTTTFTGQEGEPDCGGCTDVSIAYHMKVIAYSDVPEMDESKKSG